MHIDDRKNKIFDTGLKKQSSDSNKYLIWDVNRYIYMTSINGYLAKEGKLSSPSWVGTKSHALFYFQNGTLISVYLHEILHIV